MNKELEYLEELKDYIEYFTRLDYVEPIVRGEVHQKFKDIYWNKLPHLETIEKALLELKTIKEAKPSEAIKCLEELERDIKDRVILAEDRQLKLCATIKQALLKVEKLEKAWEIVKEKDVDIFMLKRFKTLETYNNYAKDNEMKQLTKEKFDLLKEMLE